MVVHAECADISLEPSLEPSEVDRLLSESYRVLCAKDRRLLDAVLLASGQDEEDIRQECYLRGWLAIPYAEGSWRERVNYVYVVMVNTLRDLSRYWRRRSLSGLDSVQVGSLDAVSSESVWYGRSSDEGLEDYLMRVEREGLRRRLSYLERLVRSSDPVLWSEYSDWVSCGFFGGGEESCPTIGEA